MHNRIALLALLSCAVACQLSASADGASRQKVRVLFAGESGTERTKDFMKFLDKHFVRVGFVSYEKFLPRLAKDYDVVIFDWGRVYSPKEGRLNLPKRPALPADFDRPSVLIGSAGIRIAESLKARLNWL